LVFWRLPAPGGSGVLAVGCQGSQPVQGGIRWRQGKHQGL